MNENVEQQPVVTEHASTIKPIDPFLRLLVDIANADKNEFGITLLVGGFLVCGTLVGARKYTAGFAGSFASAIPDQHEAERIHTAFMTMAPAPGIELAPAECIHLEDARFFTTVGEPIPSTRQGVWWRGRLAAVGGFHLGVFGVSR